MNDIVERLRDPEGRDSDRTMSIAADLIEQQAKRIRELETQCNVAVEQFRYVAKALEAKDKQLAALRAALDAAKKVEPVSWKPSGSATEQLWEALGRWSAYIASNGGKAELAPPQYLLDAIDAFTTPQPTERQEPKCHATETLCSTCNNDFRKCVRFHPPQPAPDGWKIVPIVPTEEMINAGMWEDGSHTAKAVWNAMVKAAPKKE